jgi:hypothetical protein
MQRTAVPCIHRNTFNLLKRFAKAAHASAHTAWAHPQWASGSLLRVSPSSHVWCRLTLSGRDEWAVNATHSVCRTPWLLSELNQHAAPQQ